MKEFKKVYRLAKYGWQFMSSIISFLCFYLFFGLTWIPKVLGDIEASLGMGILMVTLPGMITIAALYFSRMKKETV